MADVVLKRSAEIAGFDPFVVSPANAAQSITGDVFMAHGTDDQKIPIGFGRINFDKLSGQKEFVEVQGAGHLNLRKIGGLDYESKMRNFLEDQLPH